jgi:RHS repeat-associated protein
LKINDFNKANAGNATSYPAAYNAVTNQVSSGISPLPGYDKNGNQLSSTGLDSISWNAAANPVSITPLSGSAIAGTYDAFGRLVAITSGGTTKQFIYAPQGDKYAVIQGGALAKETVSLPGGETAIYNTTSGPPYIRHTDWLGSSRLATTWAHAVYSKESYAPFGETYNEAGTADRSFTGQDQDTVTGSAATGIYDFLFRKYDPAAGRWLSPDPAGWQVVDQADPKSLNRYAYVENMPMTFVDLDGRSCVANNVYDGSGNLVSVSYVDDGDGQGCAAAGVAQGPNGTNDGTPGVTVNGNPSCNGNPNCVVVNPPPDCGFQCLLDYSSVITQLQNSGEQVYVLPLQGQSGAAPSNGSTPAPNQSKWWPSTDTSTCSYPSGGILQGVCTSAGNGPRADSIRGCLQQFWMGGGYFPMVFLPTVPGGGLISLVDKNYGVGAHAYCLPMGFIHY